MLAPALSPKLADTLAAFRAGGVTISDAELAWLVALRYPCDHPDDGSVAWVPGAALDCCGYKFWALTPRARNWFLRAFNLLADNRADQTSLYLYAHTQSEPGNQSLQRTMSAKLIRAMVREWADNLAIPEDAMIPLCDRLRDMDGDGGENVPDPDAKPKRDNEPKSQEYSATAFAAQMCRVFEGTTPEYWLSGIAEVDAMAMLTHGQSENFAMSAGRTVALHNYSRAVRWIWRNHPEAGDEYN